LSVEIETTTRIRQCPKAKNLEEKRRKKRGPGGAYDRSEGLASPASASWIYGNQIKNMGYKEELGRRLPRQKKSNPRKGQKK